MLRRCVGWRGPHTQFRRSSTVPRVQSYENGLHSCALVFKPHLVVAHTVWLETAFHFTSMEALGQRDAHDVDAKSVGARTAKEERQLKELGEAVRQARHFEALPPSEVRDTAKHIEVREYQGEEIIQPSSRPVNNVHLVLKGQIQVLGSPEACVTKGSLHVVPAGSQAPDQNSDLLCWLAAGDVFGFDSLVTDTDSEYEYRAAVGGCTVGTLSRDIFCALLGNNPAFAASIAQRMCEDMDAFTQFKEYSRAVFTPAKRTDNVIDWHRLLRAFGEKDNSIYQGQYSTKLDTGAWSYAIDRLPHSIVKATTIELCTKMPPLLAPAARDLAREFDTKQQIHDTDKLFDGLQVVGTKGRRRYAFEHGGSKLYIVLRDPTTDYLDVMDCLATHVSEASKLRNRVLRSVTAEMVYGLSQKLNTVEEESDIKRVITDVLPFSAEEADGLVRLWGKDALKQIGLMIQSDSLDTLVRVNIHSYRHFSRSGNAQWAGSIRKVILQRLSLQPGDPLPEQLIVDVISSNTHAAKNLLCCFVRKHQAAIDEAIEERFAEASKEPWVNRDDLRYHVLSKDFITVGNNAVDFEKDLASSGVFVIHDTSETGLQVDVIDVSALNPETADPWLRGSIRVAVARARERPHFIINHDYPFAQQAEFICKAMMLEFGGHMRSMNVMGKGGGVVGKRGDMQVPSHVIFSKASVPYDDFVDELRPCGNSDITVDDVKQLVAPRPEDERGVHEGNVLTVAGTMNQNAPLLHLYRNLWRCVGMEMEGSYFARALHEGVERGTVQPDLRTRFLYYTSDTPLVVGESLSRPKSVQEAVPPEYAILRLFLDRCLKTV